MAVQLREHVGQGRVERMVFPPGVREKRLGTHHLGLLLLRVIVAFIYLGMGQDKGGMEFIATIRNF